MPNNPLYSPVTIQEKIDYYNELKALALKKKQLEQSNKFKSILAKKIIFDSDWDFIKDVIYSIQIKDIIELKYINLLIKRLERNFNDIPNRINLREENLKLLSLLNDIYSSNCEIFKHKEKLILIKYALYYDNEKFIYRLFDDKKILNYAVKLDDFKYFLLDLIVFRKLNSLGGFLSQKEIKLVLLKNWDFFQNIIENAIRSNLSLIIEGFLKIKSVREILNSEFLKSIELIELAIDNNALFFVKEMLLIDEIKSLVHIDYLDIQDKLLNKFGNEIIKCLYYSDENSNSKFNCFKYEEKCQQNIVLNNDNDSIISRLSSQVSHFLRLRN